MCEIKQFAKLQNFKTFPLIHSFAKVSFYVRNGLTWSQSNSVDYFQYNGFCVFWDSYHDPHSIIFKTLSKDIEIKNCVLQNTKVLNLKRIFFIHYLLRNRIPLFLLFYIRERNYPKIQNWSKDFNKISRGKYQAFAELRTNRH